MNKRQKAGVTSLLFGLALGVVVAGGSPALAYQPQSADKVTLCHATGSETSPYEKVVVADSATKEFTGHRGHEGPLWTPGAETWGDIIPPVAGVTDGLNWPEGEAIFNADCDVSRVSSGSGTADGSGEMPATGAASKEILLVGAVSVALGAMLLGLKRKSAVNLS